MSLPKAQILYQIQNSNDKRFWEMLSGLYFPADGKGFTPASRMLDSIETLEPCVKKHAMRFMLEKVVSILQNPVDKTVPNRDQFLTFTELFDLAMAFSANKDIYTALIEKDDVDYLRKATSLDQLGFKRFAILYFSALLQHQIAAETTEDHLKFWLKYLRYSNDWNIFNGVSFDDSFNRSINFLFSILTSCQKENRWKTKSGG